MGQNIRVMCVENGEVYPSMSAASRILGVPAHIIRRLAFHGGSWNELSFEFVDLPNVTGVTFGTFVKDYLGKNY